ncbi:MAG: glycosyltransferase family 4 protein [Thermodesulforhabdaceae bacterium]
MKSKHPKIAFLSSEISPHTGWGRYTREFCLALYKKKIPFELHLPVNLKNSNHREETSLRIYYTLPPFAKSFRWKPWYLINFIRQCARINLGRTQYVHSLIEFPYSVTALLHADSSRIPFGLTLHGTYSIAPQRTFPDRIFFRKALSKAKILVAVSRHTARRTEETFGKKLEIEVIHPGINSDFLVWNPLLLNTAKDLLSGVNIPSDARIILSVGALKPRKGVDILIKATAKVIKFLPNTHVLIAGPGNPAPYQHIARNEGVEKHVHFLGVLDDISLKSLYHRCDVFALLSREDEKGRFEGFGLVYLEASACRKAVVGTLCGGIPEAVANGETGILVPPDDPDAAAEAIISILADRDLTAKYGNNGQFWASRFSWDKTVDDFIKLVEQKTGLNFGNVNQ